MQLVPSLEALKYFAEDDFKIIITYPNMDAGSGDIVRIIKRYEHLPNFFVHNSLGRWMYLGLLNIAKVVVGNSSSGILETPTFRRATVDIGPRQKGRLRANNVISVGYDGMEIQKAIEKALYDPKFRENLELHNYNNPYGDGFACEHIVGVLKETKLDRKLLQKSITY